MKTSPKLEMDNIWTKIIDAPRSVDLILNALETTLMGGLGIYHTDGEHFLSGLVPLVVKTVNAIVIDKRKEPTTPKAIPEFVDRYYQRDAVATALRRKRGIIKIPTGGGKCLKFGTAVLKFDGSIVPVEQIVVGDLLMGPDSKPRKVLSTVVGTGPLYKINPIKGSSWICNDAHILVLKETVSGKTVEISVIDYLNQTKYFKHLHKQFSTGVEFAEKVQSIDPYFLGVWYGDGTKTLHGIQITKPDEEIALAVKVEAERFNCNFNIYYPKTRCINYTITTVRGQPNYLLQLLRKIVGDKTNLAKDYLTGSRAQRLEFLAGLLDTDGYLHNNSFEIVQKRKGWADDICFLARSLGFRALITLKIVNNVDYWRVSISGDVSVIPVRIPRKQATTRLMNKDATRTGFSVESIGNGQYAGFELDSDGRFLLGDFTVTHNTRVAAGILESLDCTWLYLVHKANLVESAAATFKTLLKEDIGRVHGGVTDTKHRVVCATFKSLACKPELLKFIQSVEGVIVDEAHTLPAREAFSVVLSATNAYYRIGLGATPLFREDRRDLHTIALLGPEIYSITPDELAAKNFLVLPKVEWINCAQRAKEIEFDKVYTELIVESNLRNNLLIAKLLKAPKPAIVFVKLLQHQDRVMEILRRYGAKSFTFVRGDTSTEERGHVVDRMIKGTLDIIVSSSVFNEGMDAPNLRTVINATGQSSWIAAIQEPGRGTRPASGKNSFKMYDFNDVGNKWFEMHTAQRYAAYRAAGYTVPTPSPLAAKVLDTLTERCSMLEPKAYLPPKHSNLYYLIGFGLLLGLIALLQN